MKHEESGSYFGGVGGTLVLAELLLFFKIWGFRIFVS